VFISNNQWMFEMHHLACLMISCSQHNSSDKHMLNTISRCYHCKRLLACLQMLCDASNCSYFDATHIICKYASNDSQ
jgi:hypothetical protein